MGTDQTGNGKEKITISQPNGVLFTVTREITIETPGDFGDGKGKNTHAVVQSIGVINADGSFYLAKKGDSGFVQGWVHSPDEIHTSYVESGPEPVVAKQVLTRVANASSSPTS